MNDSIQQLERAHVIARDLRTQIGNAVVGQDDTVGQILATLIAAGHVLIEGVPGLGKTLLVRALARTFAGEFARIQFTPDLMPADVTGHTLYDQNSGQIVLALVEGVKGRPLGTRSRELAQQVGLSLLVFLMGYAFWNDLSRYWSRIIGFFEGLV